MNKADLAEILSSKADIPKIRASHFINILTDAIREELAGGGRVTISDFGTFTDGIGEDVDEMGGPNLRDIGLGR